MTAPVGVCKCALYSRPTERAARAAARWLGRAEQESAEEAAASGMFTALEDLSIDGRIVIGLDDGPLAAGQRIGAGGESVDLALDPSDPLFLSPTGCRQAEGLLRADEALALAVRARQCGFILQGWFQPLP